MDRIVNLSLKVPKIPSLVLRTAGAFGDANCNYLPSPYMSVPPGEYLMGVNPYIIRPDGYPEMVIYYFLNDDYDKVIAYDDEILAVTESTAFTIWGKMPGRNDGRMSHFTYNPYIINDPTYGDLLDIRSSVFAADMSDFWFPTPITLEAGDTLDFDLETNQVMGNEDAFGITFE